LGARLNTILHLQDDAFFSAGSEKQLVAFSFLLLHFLYYRLSLADSLPLPSKFILHNNRYNISAAITV
jgi:hypothetical protein